MKALRVADDFYVNADRIEVIQRAKTRPANREVKRATTDGTLFNATQGKVARAVITLRSGWVVVSPNAPDTLVSRPRINPPAKTSTRNGAPLCADLWEESSE